MGRLEPVTGSRRAAPQFRWYLANNAFYFLSIGIGMVLNPFIVTQVLNAPAELVGTTQALIMLPLLMLLLFGGAKADRSDLRSWMMRLHLFQTLPPMAMAVLLFMDALTLPLLILLGICGASLGSFAGPTRDSLLTRVADSDHPGGMQRAVGFVITTQTLAQFTGITLMGAAEILEIALFPALVAINYLICAVMISRIDPTPAPPARERAASRVRGEIEEILEGVREVWGSPRIRPVVWQMFFASLLFMGSVMVLLPVMIRDVYNGGALDFSLVFLCFFGGIGLSATLIAQRPVQKQGKVLMIAMSAGGIAMVFVHFHPPFWGLLVVVFFWGLMGGATTAMSRTIVQTSAAPGHLARTLSVFIAAALAGGPAGSFTIGYLIGWLGPLDAALVPAFALIFVWIGLFLFTPLWKIEAIAEPAPQ